MLALLSACASFTPEAVEIRALLPSCGEYENRNEPVSPDERRKNRCILDARDQGTGGTDQDVVWGGRRPDHRVRAGPGRRPRGDVRRRDPRYRSWPRGPPLEPLAMPGSARDTSRNPRGSSLSRDPPRFRFVASRLIPPGPREPPRRLGTLHFLLASQSQSRVIAAQ